MTLNLEYFALKMIYLVVFVFALVQTTVATHELENIPRIPISLMNNPKYSFPSLPVIYVDDKSSNSRLSEVLSRQNLITQYGNQKVKLSSSNTYSHGLKVMNLQDYITEWVDADLSMGSHSGAANESFYLFGNNYDGVFKDLADQYVTPPCPYCDVAGAKTIGIGGKHSGVSFHFHAEGFSEVIIGSKQWFLFPPELTSLVYRFSPNMTVYQWTRQIYPKLLELKNSNTSYAADQYSNRQVNSNNLLVENSLTGLSDNIVSDEIFTPSEWNQLANSLYHTTIYPGELLFFPTHWMHATLNLDAYNVFYSLFIDVQLMK